MASDNPIWKVVRDIVPIETTKEASLVVMEHHANRQIDSLKKQAALLVEQATEIQNRMKLAQLISTAEYSFKPIMLREYYLYERYNKVIRTVPQVIIDDVLVGGEYYLYERSGKYILTLIAPEEWCGGIPYGKCVARVRQLGDSTWEEVPEDETEVSEESISNCV